MARLEESYNTIAHEHELEKQSIIMDLGSKVRLLRTLLSFRIDLKHLRPSLGRTSSIKLQNHLTKFNEK